MANKPKLTAEYFPHYAQQKKLIPILKAKFGSDGYAFWFQLLELMCSSEGHFIDCSAPGDLDFLASKFGIPVERIELILRELLFRGNLHRELWETSRILWCQNFVDGLSALYAKRKSAPEMPIPTNQFDSRDGNAILSTEKTGSKVKESKEDLKPIVDTPENQEHRRLAFLLHLKIKSRNPGQKEPNMTSWTKEITRMVEIDNRQPDEIERIINWCQADEFWQNNILSTAKLREKFDQLVLKSSDVKSTTKNKEPTIKLPDINDCRKYVSKGLGNYMVCSKDGCIHAHLPACHCIRIEEEIKGSEKENNHGD